MDRYEMKKDEILNDVSELLRFESVTHDREKNREALQWVIDKAKELGLCGAAAIEGEVAVITLGFGDWSDKGIEELKKSLESAGRETLGILAHVDVVPADGHWTSPPFSGTIKDGHIWGRGVIDDKGPLVLCLHAMAELLKICKETDLKRNILMVVGSREEDTWLDMDAFNKLNIYPDFGFTPDGEFPVANREKGYLDVSFKFKREDADRNYILTGGVASNMVPASAQMEIKDADGLQEKVLAFEGVATHSSRPENGENAIVKMADSIDDELLPENVKRVLGFIKECLKDYYGSGLGLDSGETTVGGEYFHRNVISAVMLNTHKTYYEITANMRSTWGYTSKEVLEALSKTASDWNAEIEILESMDPIMVSRESEFLQTVEKVYREEVDGKFEFELAYGTSYAKAMPNIVSFGPVFPGDIDTCHEADERADIERFMLAGKIYWRVMQDLCI